MTEKPFDEYRDRITGPVAPIPTPFTENNEVDCDAIQSYLGFLTENGIQHVMTTVGTSRYNLLTHEEIVQANNALIQAMKGKGTSIVSTPLSSSTETCIQIGKRAEEAGGDILLVFHPERFYGEEGLYRFFKAIASEVNMAILIHEMPMRNGKGGGNVQYPISLLNRLLDIPNVVGMKEEALDAAYSEKVLEATADRSVMIGAGGGMSRYLKDHGYGAKAFLSGIGNFFPSLELEFYDLMMKGHREQAREIVEQIEKPYFNEIVPIGWHPALKASLHLKGLMPPHERSPMERVDGEELALLEKLMKQNGWL